jgi:hypothetical protein
MYSIVKIYRGFNIPIVIEDNKVYLHLRSYYDKWMESSSVRNSNRRKIAASELKTYLEEDGLLIGHKLKRLQGKPQRCTIFDLNSSALGKILPKVSDVIPRSS